jgi:hypothetical protein
MAVHDKTTERDTVLEAETNSQSQPATSNCQQPDTQHINTKRTHVVKQQVNNTCKKKPVHLLRRSTTPTTKHLVQVQNIKGVNRSNFFSVILLPMRREFRYETLINYTHRWKTSKKKTGLSKTTTLHDHDFDIDSGFDVDGGDLFDNLSW